MINFVSYNFILMGKVLEILVTNDDGVTAPGINALAQMLREFGNVTVVAPTVSQSGASAAFTMDRPLRLDFLGSEPAENGLGSIRRYSFDGTPVDCAKMGINICIDEGFMPDLVASGINHGSNASAAAIYSGTLGAAREGTLYGVPSVGFSIDSHDLSKDLSPVIHYSRMVVRNVLENGLTLGTFLNVNFPAVPLEKIKGFKMATQGRGRWEKEFRKRTDPRGRDYYWIVGEFHDLEDGTRPMADHALIEEGYITVCPLKVNSTDFAEIERLGKVWKEY